LGLYILYSAKETLAHGKEDGDKNQKEAYKMFSRASGIFQFVSEKTKEEKGDQSDLRPAVSLALSLLALAEWETITADRAEISNHTPLLISGICRGISERFQKVKDTLLSPNPTPNPSVDDKFIAFLDCRINLYTGKAYYFQGLHFVNPEATSAGKAVKAFDLALEYLEQSNQAYAKFSSNLPPTQKSESLDLLTATRKAFHEKYLKIKSENDVVYYDQIPSKPDDLPEAKNSIEAATFDFPATQKDKWNDKIYGGLSAKSDALEAAKNSGGSGCCIIF